HMALPGRDGILCSARLPRKVGAVLGEEPHTGNAIESPAADLARGADLGLERPPVVTEVHELRRFVLAPWRDDGHASAEHQTSAACVAQIPRGSALVSHAAQWRA